MQKLKELIAGILGGAFGLAWVVAGPITFILGVVDTWQGSSSAIVKILVSLTLDTFLAAIWPITWLLWFVFRLGGSHTPLDLLF